MPARSLPPVPNYDGKTLAGVLPALADSLGVHIPARPSVGIGGLGQAGAGALVDPSARSGTEYRKLLDLPTAQKVVVVLIDGLGWQLLAERGGHAPFLRSLMEQGQIISAGFPTTTVTSMAMFGVGKAPGASKIAGYSLRSPTSGKLVNLLNWRGEPNPASWQPHPTVFEKLIAADVPVLRTGAPHFADSGLTQVALRGGDFAGFSKFPQGVDLTLERLRAIDGGLVYLYWWEIDRIGHHAGWKSMKWADELTALDGEIRRLVESLPAGTLLALTADHGMVDVPLGARRDLASDAALRQDVELMGGEPRMAHLYCRPGTAAAVAERWRNELGDSAWVLTQQEAINLGLFGVVEERTLDVLGDVIVAMRDATAVVDSRVMPPHSLKLIGLHGSATAAETEIPLLTYQA